MVHQHGSEWPDPQSFKTLAERWNDVWLKNMGKLQLLRAKGDYVESIFSGVQSPQLLLLSPRLVWLSWDSCPCTSLPAWIPLQNLRVLEINGSKLDTLWPDEYDQVCDSLAIYLSFFSFLLYCKNGSPPFCRLQIPVCTKDKDISRGSKTLCKCEHCRHL